MLKTESFRQIEGWSLSCLENIFYYALEHKSKFLIQACIFIMDREFNGIASFTEQTQVKFLLESIRHIVEENCQEEFVHILRYLELIRTLCPNEEGEQEYINAIVKIKQSFILYTLLDNASAASVCQLMNDFFPPENVLQVFGDRKGKSRGRFLAVAKRQIFNFRKLVVKLLTDMEFRSFYFFDEWMDEFGDEFQKELRTNLHSYLKRVESNLLTDKDWKQIFQNWLEMEQISNPAMLFFIKLLTSAKNGKLPEVEVLKLFSWMFPTLDFSLLSSPCTGMISIPEICQETNFLKIFLKAGWKIHEKKPWDYSNFHQLLISMFKEHQSPSSDPENSPMVQVVVRDDENDIIETPLKVPDKEIRVVERNKRTPLEALNSNSPHCLSSQRRRTKRKRLNDENITSAKRRRLKSPPEIQERFSKLLLVNLSHNNACSKPRAMPPVNSLGKHEALKLSVDSPQSQCLLASSSKFFSARRKEQTPSKFCTRVHRKDSSLLSETSTINFSSDENNESDLEQLKSVQETCGLTWISTTKNQTKRKLAPKTCRSLCFKSESSDEYVSESEPEYCPDIQPMVKLQDCNSMLLPDLTYHIRNEPDIQPCYISLTCLSSSGKKCKDGHLEIENFKIVRREDIDLLLGENKEFHFRNYSSS